MLEELEQITPEMPEKEARTLLVKAVRKLDQRVDIVADHTSAQDMSLMDAIVDLRNETRSGFKQTNQRLEALEQGQLVTNQRLESLEQGQLVTNQRLESLEQGQLVTNQRLEGMDNRLSNLEHSQNQMVDLLRMIVENTRRT